MSFIRDVINCHLRETYGNPEYEWSGTIKQTKRDFIAGFRKAIYLIAKRRLLLLMAKQDEIAENIHDIAWEYSDTKHATDPHWPREVQGNFRERFDSQEDFLAGFMAFQSHFQTIKPKWISVHDKLPKPGEYVAWCNQYSGIIETSEINPNWDGCLKDEYFTHWMAFPPMPKEEDGRQD